MRPADDEFGAGAAPWFGWWDANFVSIEPYGTQPTLLTVDGFRPIANVLFTMCALLLVLRKSSSP